jgi:site-specific DNA-cytosine methylase
VTAYYNDNDPFACRVLRKQVATGNLPPGDVDDRDIRDVEASDLAGYHQIHLFAGIGGIPLGLRWAGVPDDFDICTGGFPCQDISHAGKRAGIDGKRSGLWREFARIIGLVRPRYVLVENVATLLVRGMGRVLGDLAEIGYDAEWEILPAAAFGAPHLRDRVFVLAYPRGPGLPDAEPKRAFRGPVAQSDWWAVEPGVVRMAHGVPGRVDRIRSLGNAVVPQVAQWLGERIIEHAGG